MFVVDDGNDVIINSAGGFAVISLWRGNWGFMSSGTGTLRVDASTNAGASIFLFMVINNSELYLMDVIFGKAGNAGTGDHIYCQDSYINISSGITIEGTAGSFAHIKCEQVRMTGLNFQHGSLTLNVDPLWPNGCLLLERYSYCYWNPDGGVTGTSSGPKVTLGSTCWLTLVQPITTVPGSTSGEPYNQGATIVDLTKTTGGVGPPQGLISLHTGLNHFYVATTGSDITGDGSQANPWATPQHAADEVSFKYFVPAGIDSDGWLSALYIHVAAGTYDVGVGLYLGPVNSGWPVWFVVDAGNDVLFTYTDTVDAFALAFVEGGNWGFWLQDASGKFKLDATNALPASCLIYAFSNSQVFLRGITLGNAPGGSDHIVATDSYINIEAGFPGVPGIVIEGTANSFMHGKMEQSRIAGLNFQHGSLVLNVDPLWPGGCILLERYSYCYWNPDQGVTGTSSGPKLYMQGMCWFTAGPPGVNTLPGATLGGPFSQGATILDLSVSEYTVATLPPAVSYARGYRTHVTDAQNPVFMSPVVGGGTSVPMCPVINNGTTWLVG
jgi:hypothetical protein